MHDFPPHIADEEAGLFLLLCHRCPASDNVEEIFQLLRREHEIDARQDVAARGQRAEAAALVFDPIERGLRQDLDPARGGDRAAVPGDQAPGIEGAPRRAGSGAKNGYRRCAEERG